MGGHVFISYCHSDSAYVQQLYALLVGAGIPAWYDDSLQGGMYWETEVCRQIDSCAALLLVMTPDAEQSEFVRNEIARARDCDRPILPLLLQGQAFIQVAALEREIVLDGAMPRQRFIKRISDLTGLRRPDTVDEHPRCTSTARTLFGHTAGATAVMFSPDGHHMATGSANQTGRIWDVLGGAVRHTVPYRRKTRGSSGESTRAHARTLSPSPMSRPTIYRTSVSIAAIVYPVRVLTRDRHRTCVAAPSGSGEWRMEHWFDSYRHPD